MGPAVKTHRTTVSGSVPSNGRVHSSPSAPTNSSLAFTQSSAENNGKSDWRNRYQRSISSQNMSTPRKSDERAAVDPAPYWMSTLHPPDEDYGSDDDDDEVNGHSPMNSMSARNKGEEAPSSVLIRPPAPPRSPSNATEERERLEWQSMLASVLTGDVLQGESSRIGEERGGDETYRHELGRSLWWQIRARLRGRSEDEEKNRTEDRRGRFVDVVLEEVEKFMVKPSPGPAGVDRRLSSEENSDTKEEDENEEEEEAKEPEDEEKHVKELTALDQVSYILQKLSIVEGLYPHTAAFRAAKPLYNSDRFQKRIDALTSWSTVVYLLQTQLAALQAWTGSDELDITKPNTTKEKALVNKNRYHPLDAKARATNDQAADDSTFLERIMKEDSLQRTFSKRIFLDMSNLLANAKDTVIDHLPLFNELHLPDFQFELVRLIGFPGRLVIEALKVRIDAARKLVDPNTMVINDMIDNFRQTIGLAVGMKHAYQVLMEPDEEKHWNIPPCYPPEYDSVLLDGLRMFFRLLQYKLKNGSKTIYFRETEVLEGEMDFLSDTALAIPGGDVVVAEHLW